MFTLVRILGTIRPLWANAGCVKRVKRLPDMAVSAYGVGGYINSSGEMPTARSTTPTHESGEESTKKTVFLMIVSILVKECPIIFEGRWMYAGR